MGRVRSLLVVAGALTVIPLGYFVAKIVRVTIVLPVLRALPGVLFDDVRDTTDLPEPRLRLVGQHDLESTQADAERHSYVIDTTGEEAPSPICSLRNQARIVPFYENGMPSGFRVLSIATRSIYRRLGIENGDVIRRINGERLDSPDKALELYGKLRDQKWIDVELERNGHPVLNVYRID